VPARAWIAAVCAVLLLSPAAAQDQVARGKYLAVLGDCASCHTAPGGAAKRYAGGLALGSAFGTLYSANITPDMKTGIGSWTSDQFFTALHDGIAPGDTHLYPAFPYPDFTEISRADSDALFAYLKSLKPVSATPPPNRLVFPTNIRATMIFWNLLYLDNTRFKTDPSKSPQWNRGAEIVNGLGHCGDCHTPKTAWFAVETGKTFEGDTIDGWFAADLTGSRRDGLGQWSAAEIAEYLKTGRNRFGRVTGPMQEVVQASTSAMTDADRYAIAVYLKSVPPAPENAPTKPDPRAMADGQAIFVERCAVCHEERGTRDYPALANNSIVQARNAGTVLRVILQGSQSAQTANGPIGYSMPAFPVLDDQQLAAVATYIRNAWGNRAPPVSERQVADLRKLIAATR
jgi:mono/diheme cytochrome c family protein